MDIQKILADFHEQRDRVDAVIEALEGFARQANAPKRPATQMADSESYHRIEEWYQRLREWATSLAYSKEIS